MGGRGASTGRSYPTKNNPEGNEYGTQYHTLFESGNIKFVSKNERESEPLMETMTKGRVYVTVGGKDLLSITYFDKDLKRIKRIDLDHLHNGLQPHVQHGYFNNELDVKNGVKLGATRLNVKEKQMVSRVEQMWKKYLNR